MVDGKPFADLEPVVWVAKRLVQRGVADLDEVRRHALGKGRKRQALQRVDGAVRLDAHQRARALEPGAVVVEVRVEPRHRVVRHAARLARHLGKLLIGGLHQAVLREVGAVLVDERLAHEDLAVVPAWNGSNGNNCWRRQEWRWGWHQWWPQTVCPP